MINFAVQSLRKNPQISHAKGFEEKSKRIQVVH